MGYPGKNHKSYQTPKRPFEKTRIESETRLVIEYGLRNKREVWKAQEDLRKYRKAARDLLALLSSDTNRALVEAKEDRTDLHMQRTGLLGPVPISKCASHSESAGPRGGCQTIVTGKALPVHRNRPAADHPWAYSDWRQARHHPRLPCEQD